MAKKKASSIEELFERGFHIELECITKRMDTPKGRDWCIRYCWTVIMEDAPDLECEWEGFDTAKECIDDLLRKVK